jgi:DNA-binding CsgD family transcriptional regulator
MSAVGAAARLGAVAVDDDDDESFTMDEQCGFDHIVGLLYESAGEGQGPDTIVDALSLEVAIMDGRSAASEVDRALIKAFVGGVVDHGHGAWAIAPSEVSETGVQAAMAGVLSHWRSDAHRLLHRLAPHIRRSSSLRQRMRVLEESHHVRQMELAQLPFGLVWIGPGLQVVSTNTRGGEILKSADGLRERDARLYAWIALDSERLDVALHAALRSGDRKGRLLAIRRRAQTLPLLATVVPAVRPPGVPLAPTGPLALVILQTPDETSFGLEHLQLVYGFTTAERALAEALLRNETVESYADAGGVTRNTVRSHLARLFAKTGTSRQAELVRLLMLARPAV